MSKLHTVPPERFAHPSKSETPLYDLVEDMFDGKGKGFKPYDYAKAVWLGSPDPRERLAGEHPWPTREHDGETFVYSVPIHAGFSAVRGTALFIGKDPWHEVDDPRTWLVAEADLRTGEEYDYRVLTASVDQARQLWLQLAPRSLDRQPWLNHRKHWPPQSRQEHATGLNYDPHPRDQFRIEGRLTPDYYLENAEMRRGLINAYTFEDIEVLESMTRLVQATKDARNEQEWKERFDKIIEYEMGRRAAAAGNILVG